MPHVWRSALLGALGFGLLLGAHLAFVIGFYPEWVEQQGALLKVARTLGGVIGREAELATRSDFAYVASQQFFKFANSLGTLVAVLFAVGAVATEASRRTLEIWLALPVPRWRLLCERYVAGLLALAVPLLGTSACASLIARAVGVEIDLAPALMARAALHELTLLAALFSLTVVVSVVATHAIRVALVVLGLAVGMYAIYLMPVVTRYSLYRTTDTWTFIELQEGADFLPWAKALPLIGASAALLAVALALFQRRLPS